MQLSSNRLDRLPAFLFALPSTEEYGGLPFEFYAHVLTLAHQVLPRIESYEQVVGLWQLISEADVDETLRLAVMLIPAVYLHSLQNGECLRQTMRDIHAHRAQRGQSLDEWIASAIELEPLVGSSLLP
jgi:hypothetical protein